MKVLRGMKGEIINTAYITTINLNKNENNFYFTITLIDGQSFDFGNYPNEKFCNNAIEQVKELLIDEHIFHIHPEVIKPSSIVQLKSGGPLMTVENIDDERGILCTWFDDKCNQKEFFNINSLILKL